MDVYSLSDSELIQQLKLYNIEYGPILDSTRRVYQKKLTRVLSGEDTTEPSQTSSKADTLPVDELDYSDGYEDEPEPEPEPIIRQTRTTQRKDIQQQHRVMPDPEPIRQRIIPDPEPIRQRIIPDPEPVRQRIIPDPEPVRQRFIPDPEPVRQRIIPDPKPVRNSTPQKAPREDSQYSRATRYTSQTTSSSSTYPTSRPQPTKPSDLITQAKPTPEQPKKKGLSIWLQLLVVIIVAFIIFLVFQNMEPANKIPTRSIEQDV